MLAGFDGKLLEGTCECYVSGRQRPGRCSASVRGKFVTGPRISDDLRIVTNFHLQTFVILLRVGPHNNFRFKPVRSAKTFVDPCVK